jgi:hypothetical protein
MRSWKLVGIAFGLALVLLVEAAAPAAGRAATATEGRVYRGSPYGGRPDKGAATLYRASRKASAPYTGPPSV